MTHPSLASELHPLQDTKPAQVTARVDLIGEGGDVELSWGLGIGRWSLGSGPQSDIRVPEDALLKPCHLVLTVGKRYTLLKGVGAIRIAGRPIREWLIDQSTLVECGNRWLLIHPNKQSSMAVVTHDRLSEITARLASLNAPVSPPTPAKPSKDAQAIVEELRQEVMHDLASLRDTVVAIQDRIDELPDVGGIEARIGQQTMATIQDAIQAVEQELVAKIREPLRDEVLELLNDQQSRWESALDIRHRQLEDAIRSATLGLEGTIQSATMGLAGSIRSTGEELDQLQTQLARFSVEQGELRNLFSKLQEVQSESAAAIERLSTLPPSDSVSTLVNVPDGENLYQPHFDSIEPILPDVDGSTPEFISSAIPTEISVQALVQEKDEVFDFQVDDESINQRLSRMLSDQPDRRSMVLRSQLSEELARTNDTPSDTAAEEASEYEDQLDPDAIYQALSELRNPASGLSSELGLADHISPEPPLDEPLPEVTEPQNGIQPYRELLIDPIEPQPIPEENEIVAFEADPRDSLEEAEEEIVAVTNLPIEPDSRSEAGSTVGDVDESSGAAGDEDSIEEYMQRLLQRVRTGSSAGESSIAKAIEPVKPSVETGDRSGVSRTMSQMSHLSAPENAPSSASRMRLNSSDSFQPPSRTRNEVESDIEALREIANSNARRAINRSVIRRKSSNVIIKGAVVVISLVCAVAMFLMNGFRVSATLGGLVVALVISVLWGFDTTKEVFSLLEEKKQREADNREHELSESRADSSPNGAI